MLYFFINLGLSFLLGLVYSFGELLAKFKSAGLVLQLFWGRFYLLFNGLLAAFAYLIIKEFNFNFLSYTLIEGGKVLLAGGSSMVVIRSWLVSVKVNNTKATKKDKSDEGTFAPIIQVLLDYVQKEFDRSKAVDDISKIKPIMNGLNFNVAALALPYTCSNLLITMTEEDGKFIAKKVNDLSKSSIDNPSKLLNLGIILNSYIGLNLLTEIVNILKKDQESDKTITELDSLLEKFKI